VDNGDGSDDYYFVKFKEKFEADDPECFLWMLKIFNKGEEGDIVRYRRKENIYMIWEYLFDRKNIKNDPVLRKCLEYRFEEFKKKRHERFIFLSASVDITMHRGREQKEDWFDCKKKKKFDVEDLVKEHGTKFANRKLIPEVYLDWKKMEIDDYAIDMHTSAGRKMGKNKIDFIASGAVVVNEDKEYFVQEWRDCYNKAKKASFTAAVALRKKKDEAKLEKAKKEENKKVEKEAEPKKGKTDREKVRAAKYKRIKKIRGKPNFDDLEKDLEKIDVDANKIKLCGDMTCGNKVMCFEYEGKIWKEGRKSMNYNRDYVCFDECKKMFGLKKIGMERVLTNFRIEKVDKLVKSWVNNWQKKIVDEKVVYCVMNKVSDHKTSKEIKQLILGDRKYLMQFAKIGVVRGIFRVSDFNTRNAMVDSEGDFVSIDEGDIGKRLDIIGGREKWLIKALNKDKTIINEILDELKGLDGAFDADALGTVHKIMEKYKFSFGLSTEIEENWENLKKDLESEGVLFDD